MAINPTFAGFLEEEPRAAFFGTLGEKGLLDSSSRRKQANDVYDQAMQGFYGKLGEQVLGGEAPTATFTDYLKDFPFTQRFAQLGRQYNQGSQFSPRTRFLYY
jgi:hypothetical protein|tara:strand:- start:8505 stop:8813 length:309 start_codon:yes stop_codon:yes gene_type:complete